MKQLLLAMCRGCFIAAAMLIIHASGAQDIRYQYFDGADTSEYESLKIVIDSGHFNNIWAIGRPQKPLFNRAATKPNALVTDTLNFYPPNSRSTFTFGALPEWQFGSHVIAVQWQQKLDAESGRDGGMIQFSTDSGDTWSTVFDNPFVYNFYGFDEENVDTLWNGKVGFTGTDTSWKNIWLCFDPGWINTQESLLFRFTFTSDPLQTNQEGWMLDNFILHNTIIHTVEEKPTQSYLTAFPNPTTDRLYIQLQKQQELHWIEKLEILNAQGERVRYFEKIPTRFFVDVKELPAGQYFLTVQSNLRTETISFIHQPE